MARDIQNEQLDITRRSRIPEPPFNPTSLGVKKTYDEVMFGLAEELWVLPGTRVLALQIAEMTIALNRMNTAIAVMPVADEEGKPSQLYRLVVSYSDAVSKLYGKLRALPVALNDPSLGKRSLKEQERSNNVEKSSSHPFGGLIPRGSTN